MEPIYRLPPYRIESVISAADMTQIVDWGLASGRVPDAWKKTRGDGVRVAVLDTGIQQEHPDLAEQIEAAQDFTGSPFSFEDRQGHGTHCAGIVAGVDNAFGVVGVAPKVRLLIGKVLGDDGSGNGMSVARGIDWAREQRARVISMSLGSPANDPRIAAAIERAVAAGIFVICAAGNSGPVNGPDIDYPARLRPVVAVASIRRDGSLSNFSSRGASVTIAAPGEDILSCYPHSRYARLSGTSMATPFVAGSTALLIAIHDKPGSTAGIPLTPGDKKSLLEHILPHTADPGPVGHDPEYGWGVVKIGELFDAINPPPQPPQPPDVPPVGPPPDVIDGLPLGPFVLHWPARAGDLFSIGERAA